MSFRDRRPRTSTLVLTGLFLAVFALYLWVRPNTEATGAPAPVTSPSATHSAHTDAEPHAHAAAHDPFAHAVPVSPSPSPTLSGPGPSPSAASPTASGPASPAPSGTSAQP